MPDWVPHVPSMPDQLEVRACRTGSGVAMLARSRRTVAGVGCGLATCKSRLDHEELEQVHASSMHADRGVGLP